MIKIGNRINNIIRLLISYIPTRRTERFDLTIVRVDLLGDFIMRYDSLQEVKKFFVGKRVLLICPNMVKPFVENDPFFARVIGYDPKKLAYLKNVFILYKQLKNIYSRTVYFSAWERYPIGDMIVSFIKANDIVGMKEKHLYGSLQKYYSRRYTKIVEFGQDGNELEAIQTFVKNTFNSDYHYGRNPMLLDDNKEYHFQRPYIFISLSSSLEGKIWPADRFAELINHIPQNYDVVISGAGNGDVDRAEHILSRVKHRSRLINMVNKTTVFELAQLISQATLVIGNDSAAVHIAAATRVPSVCILHGAQYGRILPYPAEMIEKEYQPTIINHKMNCYCCNYRCIYEDQKPFKCLQNISSENVIQIVLNKLKHIENVRI